MNVNANAVQEAIAENARGSKDQEVEALPEMVTEFSEDL